ncbi:urease accessory protein UreF [Jannaschia sp. R86511]|uniref:urease accessory protein UreF n=1 Tax=Jannaschia sp. R86511 TaxID=3093853 RepID=UPI0036D406E9
MGALAVLLGDGRLPTGGHVHSGGLEQARADGRLRDLADLEWLLRRRLRTVGLVAAGLAAAACARPADHALLDAETDARTPSPALREASRAQGRGLLRLAAASWPAVSVQVAWSDLGRRPHHPIVLGCAAAAAGLGSADAATAAAYLSVSGPATAAQRLMALDPVAVAALTVRLAADVDEVVAGLPGPGAPAAVLPADSDPLLDLLGELHGSAADRLFDS